MGNKSIFFLKILLLHFKIFSKHRHLYLIVPQNNIFNSHGEKKYCWKNLIIAMSFVFLSQYCLQKFARLTRALLLHSYTRWELPCVIGTLVFTSLCTFLAFQNCCLSFLTFFEYLSWTKFLCRYFCFWFVIYFQLLCLSQESII
jgi:hypothetical protein